jgi:hypothetical protein
VAHRTARLLNLQPDEMEDGERDVIPDAHLLIDDVPAPGWSMSA